MRHLARVCLVGIIASGALGLSGCVPAGPGPTPSASPTSKPVFESDAAALVAATKAYAAYLAMSDTIAQEGGVNPERLASLVTPDILKVQVDQFHELKSRDLVAQGSSKFDTVSLQHLGSAVGGEAEIYLYVCLDVSEVHILDSARKDMTPNNRTERLPLQVGFEATGNLKTKFLMTQSDSWSGEDFC